MSSTRGHEGSLDRALRALAARCGGPDAPDPFEVEDALKRGFAELISFEARLQRLQKTSDAVDPRAGDDVLPESLRQQISTLRSALEDLRHRTAPEQASPLALGFVLPSKDS